MELRNHERDAIGGGVLRDPQKVLRDLSDAELSEELMVAAMARAHRRINRFNELIAERDRRLLAR